MITIPIPLQISLGGGSTTTAQSTCRTRTTPAKGTNRPPVSKALCYCHQLSGGKPRNHLRLGRARHFNDHCGDANDHDTSRRRNFGHRHFGHRHPSSPPLPESRAVSTISRSSVRCSWISGFWRPDLPCRFTLPGCATERAMASLNISTSQYQVPSRRRGVLEQ
jgi:hypothetical protein